MEIKITIINKGVNNVKEFKGENALYEASAYLIGLTPAPDASKPLSEVLKTDETSDNTLTDTVVVEDEEKKTSLED